MNIINEINKALASEVARLISDNPRIERKLRQLVSEWTVNPNAASGLSAREMDQKVARLSFRYESDCSLVLETEGGGRTALDCRAMGFRDERTKGWKFLIEALRAPRPTFNFGTAYLYPDGGRESRVKCKAYDAAWKLCDEVNRKLLGVLERELGWTFPANYKLYEKVPTGPEGERRFKFKVKGPVADEAPSPRMDRWMEKTRTEFSDLEEEEMVAAIHKLYGDYLMHPDDTGLASEKLAIAFNVGQERFGWSDRKMRAILEA